MNTLEPVIKLLSLTYHDGMTFRWRVGSSMFKHHDCDYSIRLETSLDIYLASFALLLLFY